MRAVFICSAQYSGSTLLNLLLGTHPDAAALGEITHLPKNLALNTSCSCGVPARRCAVWQQVLARVRSLPRWRDVDSNPYALHLGMIRAGKIIDARHQTRARLLYRKILYGSAFAHFRWDLAPLAPCAAPLYRGSRNKLALFEIVSEVLESDVLVDSSKHYLEAVSLYKADPSKVRVILLVRDGRGVYSSALKRGSSREAAVHEWRRTYARAIPVLRKHVRPDHLILVKYEDLAAAPERELARLCAFLGLEYTAQMLEFRSKAHHVLNGNDMRLSSAAEIRPDFGWHESLSSGDLGYFDSHAGALNRMLGYA